MIFTIPIAPVTKKNSQRIARRGNRYFILPSKAYTDYEHEAINYVPEELIEYPVNITATFYMQTKRRVDLVNLEEALLDTLVKGGCILDDNSKIVVSMDGSRVSYDKDNPRTEVEIRRVYVTET